MKKVMIPTCMSPFVVHVNGKKYTYQAGTEQEVPDEVAIVIEQHERYHEEKAKVERGEGNQGGGGSGATCKLVMNAVDEAMMANGTLYLSSLGTPSVSVKKNLGTTEYDVPCGSIIYLEAWCSLTTENLSAIMEDFDYGKFVYRVPSTPGAVAHLNVTFAG
jgi:hypothetical protein